MGTFVFGGGNHEAGHVLPDMAPGQRLVVRNDITFSVKPEEFSFGLIVKGPVYKGAGTINSHDRVEMLGPIAVTFSKAETMKPFHGLARLPFVVKHSRQYGAPPAINKDSLSTAGNIS
jgi:hypothetical protein